MTTNAKARRIVKSARWFYYTTKASIKNVTKKNLILYFDNARPHIAKSTTEKIEEFQWERLELRDLDM